MRFGAIVCGLAATFSYPSTAEFLSLQQVRLCVQQFPQKNGPQDATRAAHSAHPQFMTRVESGAALYQEVPGIAKCGVPWPRPNQGETAFRSLSEADSWQFWDHREVRQECSIRAQNYAAAFNRTLAKLRPDALRRACKAGRIDPDYRPLDLSGKRVR